MAVAPETQNFGLTRISQGEPLSKNGHAALDLDRITLDDLIMGVANHTHDAAARLADPASPPTAVAATTGGTLSPDKTYFYKIAYVDKHGLETAASTEVSASTGSAIAAPSAPTLTVQATGGTLSTLGNYTYAVTFLDSTGGETLASPPSSVLVSAGATNQITVDVPALPAGATGYRIYRARPGQQLLYFLVETATDPYVDTGATAEDATVRPPRTNSTNQTNSVTITVPDVPLPGDVYGWKIYRSLDAGRYSGFSLVKHVIETSGGAIVTEWVDDGSPLQQGTPKKTSATLGGGQILTAKVAAVTTSYTADSDGSKEDLILADATSGPVTITLPEVEIGRTLTIAKIDGSANAVTIETPNAETIDGAANVVMADQYDDITLVSDGSNWIALDGLAEVAASQVSLDNTGMTEITTDNVQAALVEVDSLLFDLATVLQHSNQSATTYTLVIADAGKVVRMTNAAASTLTIPANATVAFPVGTVIRVYSAGAGGVTISPAGGVTIRNNGAALTQYKQVELRKDGTNEWVRIG